MLRFSTQLGRTTERGFSLLEVLLALVVVSLVISAIAGGILTLVRSSTENSAQQRLQGALASYTESLKALPYYSQQLPPLPLDACVPGSPVDPATFDTAVGNWTDRWVPPAYVADASVTAVEFWSPSATGPTLGAFASTCPPAGDQGAIRLTGLVVLTDGRSSSGQVVIREPSP